MHFFDSMRRYSRNSTTTKERPPQTQTPPPVPTSPVATRQPLTNLTLVSSRSSSNSGTPSTNSSTKNSPQKSSKVRAEESESTKATHSKPSTRSERSNTVGSVATNPPATVLMSSQRSTYTNHPDLYTHNSLNSFSFGAASAAAPQSRAIDPLSPSRDDDSDEYLYKADTTPRPSLVASSSPRSHSSQLPPMQPQFPNSLPPPPRRSPAKPSERSRTISNTSNHTFGTSSASASASSLSSAAMESSGSRRGGSTTTPQTSANELTSEDDEEEHRHPTQFLTTVDSNSLYGSDDDQFDEDFDDDREPYENDIDISSIIQDDNEGVYYDDFRNYNNQSRDSFRSAFNAPRRGSLAVPIPSPNFMEGRDREDSIATLRRPSRSLEGLKSDSLAESEAQSRYADSTTNPHVPAPTSVPESDIRRRSIEHQRELSARTLTAPSLTLTSASSSSTNDASSSSTAVQSSVLDGFDSSWLINPTTGITNMDWDASEMEDIVGGIQGPRSSDRSFRRGSSSTTDSGRRLSTTSTASDPFFRGLNKWGGQQYLDEKMKWTFVREKADRLEEHRATVERDRHSISALFNNKGGYNQASSSSSIQYHEYGNYLKEGESRHSIKEPSKPKESQPWRGMALGAEEWWSSYSNGRYKVARQSLHRDPDKPPQQRVNISHHRTPYSHKRDMCDGPTSTIHKHSKAICFSISRHYRMKPDRVLPGSTSARMSTSSRATGPSAIVNVDDKKSSNMVMLATRRVHEKYTSTNTTRKLESHGLLNENGRQSPRDLERLERLERENRERRKKEKEKEKQKLKKEKEMREKEAKSKEKDKGKGKGGQRGAAAASSSESSAGSVAADVQLHTAAGPSTASLSTRPSMDHSLLSRETTSSDRTVVWNSSHNWRDEDAPDFEDDDEDEDVYGPRRRRRGPGRTPHIEAYSTLAPETLESYAQTTKPGGIFNWTKSKNTHQVPPHEMKSYMPPWPVALQSRNHNGKGIVDDLNSSFQDVGLLPAVGEIRGSSLPPRRRRQGQDKQHHKDANSVDTLNVFHSFSSDYLFMLLPLWPGETDPLSAKKFPCAPPVVPLEQRKFLLIYYTPEPDASAAGDGADGARGGRGEKEKDRKRTKPSPTSSRESASASSRAGVVGDKHILLHKFHFSARMVTYADIQGSGVRSPDVGLSVLGPLSEAIETMPTAESSVVDTFQVIGLCTSREKGIEFVPDGLEKLGLTRRVMDPAPVTVDGGEGEAASVGGWSEKRMSVSTGIGEEGEEPSDSVLVLTPIGRAVVEMAWLGCMALTSFAPTP